MNSPSRMHRGRVVALAALALTACEAPPNDASRATFGGDRPATLLPASGFGALDPGPLLIALHGYGSDAEALLESTGLAQLTSAEFSILAPQGSIDGQGSRFWNGSAACCDFDGSGVDDVAYLDGLIAEVSSVRAVSSVHVLGFDAGGFLAYGMGCRAQTAIDGIVSIAGASELVAADCAPSGPTAVLHIHGDSDPIVSYAGSTEHPGALGSVSAWAGYNQCAPVAARTGERFDLDGAIPGAETVAQEFPNCTAPVALWTMAGTDHEPMLTAAFPTQVSAWLLEQQQ